ncbi:glycosyltransferase family 4 protein [Candidatus Omnitrophota bacterium]
MRIAINSTFLNHQMRSGLLVYTENLLKGIAKFDARNKYVLLFTSWRRKSKDMPGPEAGNFHKFVLPVPDREFMFRNILLNKIILPAFLGKNSFDIYHAPAGYSLPRIKSVKKVLTIHDLRSLKIKDKTFPQDILALKRAANHADVCITVSECTKKDIIENLGLAPEKIKVIYEGAEDIFMPMEKSAAESIKEKYRIDREYLFSLGQVPRKNIERLIRAFSKFKYKSEFILVIGGAGNNGPWNEEYRNLAERLNLKNCVRFIGDIPYEDLPLLYNASEYFVFPSLYEGFGIPVLEAMSCGIPVITSNVSSLPEIAGDAALYVNPYDEVDIARKMEKAVEDKDLRKALVSRGTKRAKEFSWDKMARETLEVYEEVLKC